MKIKIIDLLNKIANGEESINVETKYDSDDWEKDEPHDILEIIQKAKGDVKNEN